MVGIMAVKVKVPAPHAETNCFAIGVVRERPNVIRL
jgi:hypothetical protein